MAKGATIQKSAEDRQALIAELAAKRAAGYARFRESIQNTPAPKVEASWLRFWRSIYNVVNFKNWLDGTNPKSDRKRKIKRKPVKRKVDPAKGFALAKDAMRFLGIPNLTIARLRLAGERRSRVVNRMLDVQAFMSSKPFTIPGISEPVLWNVQTKVQPKFRKDIGETHDNSKIEVCKVEAFRLSDAIPIQIFTWRKGEWTDKHRGTVLQTTVHFEAHVRPKQRIVTLTDGSKVKEKFGRAWAIVVRVEDHRGRLQVVNPNFVDRLGIGMAMEHFASTLPPDCPLEETSFWVDTTVDKRHEKVTVKFGGKDFVLDVRTGISMSIPRKSLRGGDAMRGQRATVDSIFESDSMFNDRQELLSSDEFEAEEWLVDDVHQRDD